MDGGSVVSDVTSLLHPCLQRPVSPEARRARASKTPLTAAARWGEQVRSHFVHVWTRAHTRLTHNHTVTLVSELTSPNTHITKF